MDKHAVNFQDTTIVSYLENFWALRFMIIFSLRGKNFKVHFTKYALDFTIFRKLVLSRFDANLDIMT